MNAPVRPPPVPDEAVQEMLHELFRQFWAVMKHCETGMRQSEVGCLEGVDLALRHAQSCLCAATIIRRGLPDGK